MNMTTPASPNNPTIRPDVIKLFENVEKAISCTSLGPDRWYLLVLAALVGGTEPMLADQLYLYLINKPSFQTPSSRQALTRRLREALFKIVSVVGVCKPIEAVLAISKVERPEDRDYTCTRSDWTADATNYARGKEWLRTVYGEDTEKTLALFDAHRDFGWHAVAVTYGLFLSDRQVLDDMDTELVTLVGIAIQNLPLETGWHIKGAKRVGMKASQIEAVFSAIKEVGKFMGVKLDRLPAPKEILVASKL